MLRADRLLLAVALLTVACTAPVCLSLETTGDNLLVANLKHFEVVTPFAIRKEADARHPPSLRLSITAFGRDYHMELTRHETLLGDAYAEWTVAADGSLRKQPSSTSADSTEGDAAGEGHCYYHGRLVGPPAADGGEGEDPGPDVMSNNAGEEEEEEEESLVAVSICDGLRGQIFTSKRGASLSLEPAHRHVIGEPAPATGYARGTDGPLSSRVLAFRRQDEADGFRPAAEAMLRDVERTAMNMAAEKGYDGGYYDVYEHIGEDHRDGFLAARVERESGEEWKNGNGISGGVPVPVRVRDSPTFGDDDVDDDDGGGGAANGGAGGGRRKLTQADATDVYLELIIVNDKARVDQYKGDADLLHSESIHVTNIVSTLFRGKFSPNLNIVLVSQMDSTAADPWTVPVNDKGESSPGDLLTKFGEWRSGKYAELPSHDSAHLYSGRNFEGDSVGRANQVGEYNTSVCEVRDACGAVINGQRVQEGQCYTLNDGSPKKCCRKLLSAAISQVYKGLLARDAITVAHEIGHTLGFNHDGMADDGTGDCPVNGYVMAYLFNADADYSSWSKCSHRTYNVVVKANQYACLTKGRKAVCGNGVLEPGETCDCGSSDCSVKDPCCVGNTCQLKPGAKCSAFEGAAGCCDPATCAAKTKSTVCRPKSDICDIEDKCDGSSFTCPRDNMENHGVTCEDAVGDKGSCWGKSCVNRNATCYGITSKRFSSVLFGGKTASESCGFKYNAKLISSFDATACDADFRCFKDWNVCQSTYSSTYTLPGFGALAGFPCSAPVGESESNNHNNNETNVSSTKKVMIYPMVCDGGPKGDGVGSKCVSSSNVAPASPPPFPPPSPPAPPPPPTPPPGAPKPPPAVLKNGGSQPDDSAADSPRSTAVVVVAAVAAVFVAFLV